MNLDIISKKVKENFKDYETLVNSSKFLTKIELEISKKDIFQKIDLDSKQILEKQKLSNESKYLKDLDVDMSLFDLKKDNLSTIKEKPANKVKI